MVATGGHDQPAGALGAGIFQGGEAMYATGTVECICPIFDTYTVTSDTVANNLCCYPSCIPGLFASIAFNFTGGSLLRWYRDTFGADAVREAAETGQDVYDILCRNAGPGPENVLILPHFTVTGTPHFDTHSRGAILGLTLHTTREQIVGAILSGVTYEMKLNLEMLQGAGVSVNRLRAIGGGAKSRTWVQRKADIMGVPVAVLANTEAAAFGVALLAGHAVGVVPSIEDMAKRVLRFAYVCDPDETRHREYQDRFGVFREMYPALRRINAALARYDDQG
jgi:xylulokinase